MTMDGDSSTTDASQLGISADYIGGSHYVIQPHDDTEDSMNDHEDTMVQKKVSENKIFIFQLQMWLG